MATRGPTLLRRLFQFRLRTLLLVMLIFGVCLGNYVGRVRRQQEAVAAISKLHGEVLYDYKLAKSRSKVKPLIVPSWLRNQAVKTLGMDYVYSVGSVSVCEAPGPQAASEHAILNELPRHLIHLPRLECLYLRSANDQGLEKIGRLTSLKELVINSAADVTDDGVAHLRRLTRLESLTLHRARLTDESLRLLSTLPSLQRLTLTREARLVALDVFTDQGLEHLARSTSLKRLELGSLRGAISDQGLEHLSKLGSLERLAIGSPGISTEGLIHLQRLKNLETLDIEGCGNLDLPKLRAALPGCRIAGP